MLWETRVTKIFNIKYPIIQGGLAYLAYSDLAAAVSNAGGLGQITALTLSGPKELLAEIKRTKEKTSKPFGVNFAMGQTDLAYEQMVEVAIKADVPVISITGGNPAGILNMVKGTGIKTLVLVAAKRQAEKAAELGADAVMVVGQEGGGHIGVSDTGTFVLTPGVVDHVDIPVIASGGVVDGRGLMASLALGAEGVEMGTRFIATKECIHAHPNYKQAILDADDNSTVVIKRSIRAPGRVLKNDWTDHILELESDQAGYESLKDYISGEVNKKYIHDGEESQGFGWAGQGVSRIHDIPTVAELIENMIKEAEEIRKQWK